MSTFTSARNLELVARGDDVGIWDTPTNSNWTVVDNAIGGISVIPLNNSNVTLNAAQAGSAMITFNSTLTGSVNITFPSTITGFYTIQNVCTGSSAFTVTLQTTVSGGQAIGAMPGTPFDILNDGTNIKFKSLERVGTYWDYAGSSVPAWVSICTVPPYLNCDGTTFASSTFPILATIFGGTTLPDARGRFRGALNQGTARLTSSAGLDGNTIYTSGGGVTVLSSQNMPPILITDPGHIHGIGDATIVGSGGAGDVRAGAGTVAVSCSATTGISAGSTSPTSFNAIPPAYVGGLTLIRAG